MTRLMALFILVLAMTAPAVEVVIAPVQQEIPTGAPLSLQFRAKTNEGEDSAIRLVSVDLADVRVSLLDSKGMDVTPPARSTWRCLDGAVRRWRASFVEAGQEHGYVPLGEWCSTQLPPGHYTMHIELHAVSTVAHGETVARKSAFYPPRHWQFQLTVNEACARRLDAEYERLSSIAAGTVVDETERVSREHAVDLLVHASAMEALPYQLALLNGRVPLQMGLFDECDATELAMNLIESGSLEAARGLVEIAKGLKASSVDLEQSSRDFLTTVVVWSIHEMASRGDARIAEVTSAVVNETPNPRDPRPIPGLD